MRARSVLIIGSAVLQLCACGNSGSPSPGNGLEGSGGLQSAAVGAGGAPAAQQVPTTSGPSGSGGITGSSGTSGAGGHTGTGGRPAATGSGGGAEEARRRAELAEPAARADDRPRVEPAARVGRWAQADGRRGSCDERSVRHLRRGRHPLRRRAQHGPGALRRLQRQRSTRSGAPRTTRPRTSACWRRAASPTPRRRTRSARAPPASSRSSTTSPGTATTCGTRARRGARLDVRASPAKATTESLTVGGSKATRSTSTPATATGATATDGHPDRQRARGHVHGHQRHARQQRLLLRLRQQRDRPQGRRRRAPWTRSTSAPVLVRRLLRHRPLGAGRPRVRALLPGGSQSGTPTSGRSPAGSSPPC